LFYETLIKLKKYATLLQINWLTETPQALALMRLDGKGADF
jgi:hypothetical protein